MTALRPSAEALTRKRTQLERELAAIETSLAQLTAAIESGGDLPTLVGRMKEREQAKRTIALQLAGLSDLARFEPVDSAQLRRTVEARLSDWHRLVSRHVMRARQLLRKLLVGRIRFTFDPISRTCEFAGNGVLDQLVAGIVPTQAVVSPRGIYRISYVELSGIVTAA